MVRMKVKRGHTGRFRGGYNVAGCVQDMTDAEARAAEASGDWEPADQMAQTELQLGGSRPASASGKPKGAALNKEILLALPKLGDGDFSRDAKPTVKALERALGYRVTAAERDAALAEA